MFIVSSVVWLVMKLFCTSFYVLCIVGIIITYLLLH
jgi:hypothetical protein